jgi:hypothetical protein
LMVLAFELRVSRLLGRLFHLSHSARPFCVGLFSQYGGLNSGPTPWATPPTLFWNGFFQDRILRATCLDWLQITILLISVSWVARITGMRH